MEWVGSVVLIVVTVAVGLACIAAVVQLWRHQPVHHDPDEPRGGTDGHGSALPDEETVDLTSAGAVAQEPGPDPADTGDRADEEATVVLDDAEPDPVAGAEDDEVTMELRARGGPEST